MENLSTRGHLLTEQVNVNSANLDRLTTLEIVDLFNKEDINTLNAIAGARVELASAIDTIADSLRQGGRLFYIGAGTSGRLGVLDAAECPPTFCTPPELVQGILAGGAGALIKSSEGLEDIASDGAAAMVERNVGEHDVVVGITAGGTTPYVHGAIETAKQRGAKTVFIACVPANQVASIADIDIRLPVGA
ncbi:N-acetylmuramic acid 6-phosphate etherase, partial [Chamaesiphon sp. OTE_8_metabat_110]